jgi:hypothetical protein
MESLREKIINTLSGKRLIISAEYAAFVLLIMHKRVFWEGLVEFKESYHGLVRLIPALNADTKAIMYCFYVLCMFFNLFCNLWVETFPVWIDLQLF